MPNELGQPISGLVFVGPTSKRPHVDFASEKERVFSPLSLSLSLSFSSSSSANGFVGYVSRVLLGCSPYSLSSGGDSYGGVGLGPRCTI